MSKKNLTYNEAFIEIESIVEKIENGELDVDELSENISRVSFLLAICKEKLYKAETEVEKILSKIDSKE